MNNRVTQNLQSTSSWITVSAVGPSFPVLQRVRQPLHGLVEALALRGAGFENLEGSVLQRLQPEGLVDLRNIEYTWVNSVSMHVICHMGLAMRSAFLQNCDKKS